MKVFLNATFPPTNSSPEKKLYVGDEYDFMFLLWIVGVSMARIIIVRCSRCRAKIFRYLKVGSGKLWHCWKNRILDDYSKRQGDRVLCPKCGSLIGIEKKNYVKLVKGAYRY